MSKVSSQKAELEDFLSQNLREKKAWKEEKNELERNFMSPTTRIPFNRVDSLSMRIKSLEEAMNSEVRRNRAIPSPINTNTDQNTISKISNID